jgi:hypothetical protein
LDEEAPLGARREALFSFSPIEAELPPVAAAIDRLAAESTLAACWVMQLRPQGGGCGETVAAR